MRTRIKVTTTTRQRVEPQAHWTNRPVLVKRNVSKAERLANMLFGELIPSN